MGFREVVHVARKRWPAIATIFTVCVIAAGAYAALQPKEYTSTARLYVTMATGTSVADSYQGGLAARDRVPSYVDLATGPEIAKRVIDRLKLRASTGEIQDKISATFPPATAIIELSATDSTPEGAQALADAVSQQLIGLVDEIETIENSSAPAARLRLIDMAALPTAPSAPATIRLVATGALGGLILGWLVAMCLDRFASTRGASRVDNGHDGGAEPEVIESVHT